MAESLPYAKEKVQGVVKQDELHQLKHPSTKGTVERVTLDLLMVVCQLVLALNHYRRLLDVSYCSRDPFVEIHSRLQEYPCSSSILSKLAFLASRAPYTYAACWGLPPGETWVPWVTTAIVVQFIAVVSLDRAFYLNKIRHPCIISIGFFPKVLSLASLFLWPNSAPSSYFNIYLNFEGAILAWQQLVYQFPFFQGMAVLAGHVSLTVAICKLVPPDVGFNPVMVLLQTLCGTLFAASVSLYHIGFFHMDSAKQPVVPSIPCTPVKDHRRRLDDPAYQGADLMDTAYNNAGLASLVKSMNGTARLAVSSAVGPLPAPSPKAVQLPVVAASVGAPHSLKRPKGISQFTISEEAEFTAPEVVASYNIISRIVQQGGRGAQYVSRVPRQRLYMKIPHAEPEDLPSNFLVRLNHALERGNREWQAVGCYARAGCIELVVELVKTGGTRVSSSGTSSRVGELEERQSEGMARHVGAMLLAGAGIAGPSAQQADAASSKVDEAAEAGGGGSSKLPLLSCPPAPAGMHASGGLMQYLHQHQDTQVLTQACGRVFISRWSPDTMQWVAEEMKLRPHERPRIHRIWPAVVLSSQKQDICTQAGQGTTTIQILVSNMEQEPTVWVRSMGKYLPCRVQLQNQMPTTQTSGTPVQTCDDCDDSASMHVLGPPNSAILQLEVDGLPARGLLMVECKLGKLLSNWKPVIVCDDPNLLTELQEIEADLDAEQLELYEASCGRGRPSSKGGAASNSARSAFDDLLTDLGAWLEFSSAVFDGEQPSTPSAESAGADFAEGSNRTRRRRNSGQPRRNSLSMSGSLERDSLGRVQDPVPACSPVEGTTPRALSFDMNSSVPVSSAVLAPGSSDFSADVRGLLQNREFRSTMVETGLQLLEFSIDRGWVHMADQILKDLVRLGYSYHYIVSSTRAGGLTLLHRAVRSGRVEMVDLVVQWGVLHGMPWSWDVVATERRASATGLPPQDAAACPASSSDHLGQLGITPLHIAAALDDEGALARRILRAYESACNLWYTSTDAHGVTPCELMASHHSNPLPAAPDSPPATSFVGALADAADGLPPQRTTTRLLVQSYEDDEAWARHLTYLEAQGGGPSMADKGSEPPTLGGLQALACHLNNLDPPCKELGLEDAPYVYEQDMYTYEASPDTGSLSQDDSAEHCVQGGSSSTRSCSGRNRESGHMLRRRVNTPTPAALQRSAAQPPEGPSAPSRPPAAQQHRLAPPGDAPASAAVKRQMQAQPSRVMPHAKGISLWDSMAASMWQTRLHAPQEARYLRFLARRFSRFTWCWHLVMTSLLLFLTMQLALDSKLLQVVYVLPLVVPHAVTLAVLAFWPAEYPAWREPLCAASAMCRICVKAACAGGLLQAPTPCLWLMHCGLDAVTDGLLPAIMEQVRPPVALGLRLLEALSSDALYLAARHAALLSASTMRSMVWNAGSLVAAISIDVASRRAFMASEA